jgi:hypothetical protein
MKRAHVSRLFKTTVLIVLILTIIATLTWIAYQWNECRSYGFSVLYCIQHVL